ncbi:DNA translocase FtsK [Acetohalobium arabaticum DSM 5501]|uniref:DNA translocase FtsK n=1 Tax=Acetohalobium arabaticum (strain ATCC 49924 / DSM 5501 / Z-7288) TaxID=574087 RepID=D9QRD0_ACEAZ|nr:DNA translocase FtsK [Acetohalobium arabaticum DSM 5501]
MVNYKLQDYLIPVSNKVVRWFKLKSTLVKIYQERNNELLGIFLIVLAILLGISFYFKATGLVGRILTQGFKVILGNGAYIVPFVFLMWGINLVRDKEFKITGRSIGLCLLFLVILTLFHFESGTKLEFKFALQGRGGGLVGAVILYILRRSLEDLGAYIVLGAVSLIGMLLATDLFLSTLVKQITEYFMELSVKFKNKLNQFKKKLIPEKKATKNSETVQEKESSQVKVNKNSKDNKEKQLPKQEKADRSNTEKQNKLQVGTEQEIKQPELFAEELEVKDNEYILPPLSLLQKVQVGSSAGVNQADGDLLEKTLDNFGVDAKVGDVSYGPTVTRYEVHPAPGVKVSRISSLSNDIALALAASDVRIEAPIPGKAAVGIEVPNQEQIMVSLREILESDAFQNFDSKLGIALGKDITGKSVVADLSGMPHLLVAGATGSGKSVCINSIISSLLYRGSPDELKLMLIDPKKVELNIYDKIPHLIAPVVTDPKKAASALKWVVQEMENRYELFADSGAKDIASYNRQLSEDEADQKLPYVVVIIDELSDLMMVAADAVEDAICRLAQMARAAGIHLIIATQRPSVDVITGVIKANIPSRISFAVSSQADSRTILDTGGAEKLLGKGDMLFSPVGSQQGTRIQGAFISEKEVKNLVKYIKRQDNPEYAEKLAEIKDKDITIETDDKDELYEKAVRIAVTERASISLLQRKLRIGYTRAARLIDTMEEEGIVGEHRGSKAREVLIDEEELEELLNEGGK